jgi:TPR repeat protein
VPPETGTAPRFGIDGPGGNALPSFPFMKLPLRTVWGLLGIGLAGCVAPDSATPAYRQRMNSAQAAVHRNDGATAEVEFLAAAEEGRQSLDDKEVAEALYSVGQLYRYEHRESEAVHALKEALAIEDRIFGTEDTRTGEVLAELAATYVAGAELNDAKPYIDRLRPFASKYGGTERMFIDTLFKAEEASASDLQAIDVLSQKAATGDSEAEFKLGTCYELARGVPQDFARARALYLTAAAKGNVHAMYYLGVIYDKGRGVAVDDATALQWYRQAADAGNDIAQYNYGVFLMQGRGTEPDVALALEYFRKSDAQGYPSAKRAILKAERALGVAEPAGP